MTEQNFTRYHASDTDLFDWIRLAGFDLEFTVSEPSNIETRGFVNLKRRPILPDGPVGYAVRVGIRMAATVAELAQEPSFAIQAGPPTWIKGAKSSGNIRDIADHYGEARLDAYKLVQPGAYRLTVWGDSHTDCGAGPGSIEVNAEGGALDPYNQFIVRVWSVA